MAFLGTNMPTEHRKKRIRGNNVYSESDSDSDSASGSDSDSGSSSDSHLDSGSSSDSHSGSSSDSDSHSDSGADSHSDSGSDSQSGSSSDSNSGSSSDSDSDVNLLNIANNRKQSFGHRKQAHHENLLISDEKYAQELQLQEALIFSASQSQKHASPSSQKSQKNAPSSSVPATSSSQDSYKMKLPTVKSEVAQSPSSKKPRIDAPSSSSIPPTSSSQNPLKRKRRTVKSEASELPESFCGICMDTKAPSEMFSNAQVCSHVYCSDCIRSHVSVKIKENIAKVKCPDPKCKGLIGPEICRSIIPKEVIERWEAALCESLILAPQKFYCPFKDCSAMLVDDSGVAVTSSECPNCNRLFCAQCKVAWHSDLDCREFQSLKKNERNPEDIMLMNLAKKKKWKRCPSCKYYVDKRSGCNEMRCRCGHRFCYRCGKNDKYGTHVCKSRDR